MAAPRLQVDAPFFVNQRATRLFPQMHLAWRSSVSTKLLDSCSFALYSREEIESQEFGVLGYLSIKTYKTTSSATITWLETKKRLAWILALRNFLHKEWQVLWEHFTHWCPFSSSYVYGGLKYKPLLFKQPPLLQVPCAELFLPSQDMGAGGQINSLVFLCFFSCFLKVKKGHQEHEPNPAEAPDMTEEVNRKSQKDAAAGRALSFLSSFFFSLFLQPG